MHYALAVHAAGFHLFVYLFFSPKNNLLYFITSEKKECWPVDAQKRRTDHKPLSDRLLPFGLFCPAEYRIISRAVASILAGS